jgi:hypothetical protein
VSKGKRALRTCLTAIFALASVTAAQAGWLATCVTYREHGTPCRHQVCAELLDEIVYDCQAVCGGIGAREDVAVESDCKITVTPLQKRWERLSLQQRRELAWRDRLITNRLLARQAYQFARDSANDNVERLRRQGITP